MSTIKSSAENLTLNADGSGNDVLIQSNASTKAIFTAEGSVGINTTSISIPSGTALEVYDAVVPRIKLANSTTGNASSDGFDMHIDGSTKDVKLFQRESANIILATNGAERVRVQAGGGISFNGDTAASNALNDYEEGNHASAWSSASGSITVGRNDLAYTKIGNMVHMTGEVGISSVSSPAGSRMSLPFATAGHTVDRNMNWGGQGMVCYTVAQLQDNPPCLYANAGESVVHLLYQQDDGAFADFNAAAGDTFMFSFSYKTDS